MMVIYADIDTIFSGLTIGIGNFICPPCGIRNFSKADEVGTGRLAFYRKDDLASAVVFNADRVVAILRKA